MPTSISPTLPTQEFEDTQTSLPQNSQSSGCANCGGELPVSRPAVYSPDGLAFCTSQCERDYPKPLQSPEFRNRLRGTAVCVMTSVALVLLGIIHWCR